MPLALKQMSSKQAIPDAQVLRDSVESPWMFGILVDRYQEAFLRKATSILHSEEDAEDAVQDTFIKIYKHSDKFSERKNASFSSWGYKILVNTCYSKATQRKATQDKVKIMDQLDLDVVSSMEDGTSDKLSFVRSVMARLPENLSRLLCLYFFEDKSYNEIAVSERISLSAVKSGIHRAKKQFRSVAAEML